MSFLVLDLQEICATQHQRNCAQQFHPVPTPSLPPSKNPKEPNTKKATKTHNKENDFECVQVHCHYVASFSVSEQFLIENIPFSLLSNIQNIQLSIQGNINVLKQPHPKLKGIHFEFKPNCDIKILYLLGRSLKQNQVASNKISFHTWYFMQR